LVFFVAEIGVNWDGDMEIAANMMKTAKKVGFDDHY
jgi:sialic acid synthase SpsE